MQSKRRRREWLLTLVALPLGLFAAVQLGWFDELLPGRVEGRRQAVYSIATYAALLWIATGVALLWRTRRTQIALAGLAAAAAVGGFEVYARAVELPAGIPAIANMGMFSRAHHHRYRAQFAILALRASARRSSE